MNTTFFKTWTIYALVLGYLPFIADQCHARTFNNLKVRNCLRTRHLIACGNTMIGGNLTVNGSINGPNALVQSFDVDNGANVVPVGGVVQVSGITGTGFVPSGIETHNGAINDLFIENRRWMTQYVVDPSAQVGARGTFQTIQGAIDAAAAIGGNVYIIIRPGTYTENITFRGNLHIAGASTDGRVSLVNIIGNHTYADVGACVIENLAFVASSGDIFTINPSTGSASGSLFIQKFCGHNNSGGRIAVITPTGGAFAVYAQVMCQSQSSTEAIVVVDNSFILLDGTSISNNAVTPLITVNGNAQINVTTGNLQSQGDVFQILSANATVQTQNTFCTSSNGAFVRFIAAGTVQAAHVTLGIADPSGNYVVGAGTYQYADIVGFGLSNGIDPVTTQQPADWKPFATAGTEVPGGAVRGTAAFNATQFNVANGFVSLFSPFFAYTNVAASPYTVLATDSFMSVDTSAGAITIQLPDAPATGTTFTVKDRTGNAGANNITITTVGGTVIIDGATLSTINTNFGSLQFLFNGAHYEIY